MTPTTDETQVQPPPPPASRSGWTGGRVTGLVFSSLAGLFGCALMFAGVAVLALHAFARDDDGFYTSDRERLASDGYAITTDRINLDAGVADDVPDELLGTLRVRAESSGAQPVFVGIGRSAAVTSYLGGVPHSELVDFRRGAPIYDPVSGGRRPSADPGSQSFWVAQSEGSGDQQVEWDAETGVWSVAVLNADASRGIAVDADIGAKVSWLIWVGLGLTIVGIAIVGTAVMLIVSIGRRASPAPAA